MSDVPREAIAPARHLRQPAPRVHQHGGAGGAGKARARGRQDARLPRSRTLPPFNPDDDIEDRPKPEPVATLRALVGGSDALVIAAPEYAHGLPGALKNALDWLVASETFAGKPTALINTSPRAFHAQASLREILSTMAARLVPEAFASISLTGKAVTAVEILADPVCARRLAECLDTLVAATRTA